MYNIKFYETENGHSPLRKYMDELVKKRKATDLARIYAYVDRLSEYGMNVNNIHPHTIRKLQGDIWELRPDNHRIVFFYFSGNEIVLLHAFKKQHGKAPKNEIKRAEAERDDFLRRKRNG